MASVVGRTTLGGALTCISANWRTMRAVAHCNVCGQDKEVPYAVFYRKNVRSCGCTNPATNGKVFEAVKALAAQNFTLAEIASQLAKPYGDVRRIVRRHKLTVRDGTKRVAQGSRHSPLTRSQAVEFANETSAAQAGVAYGVSERTIVRWRNGHLKRKKVIESSARVEKTNNDGLTEMISS